MKKNIAAVMAIVIIAGTLTACGRSYDADTATLYILKNGKVVSTDVEAFDEEIYDKTELESYVKDTISSYTENNGKNTVKLNKLEVSNDTALLTLEYASPTDYVNFNGDPLFVGSVAEALAAGYTFDGEFQSAKDGGICTAGEVIDDGSLHVAIVRSFINLSVSGNIVYYSGEYTKLLDKKTVSISPEHAGENNETGTEAAGTEIQGADSTEPEEAAADEGSVSDDEMLTGEPETEMTFDFGSAADLDSSSTVTAGYVYVIYQ